MIVSLICLKSTEHSHFLLELLSGHDNIAYLLPKKFVHDLLRKRTNKKLNLDPEVVAEAFLSIDDPLLIVRSGNLSPKVNAPCAIFVDIENSKLEIMSVLFPRKNTHNAGTIPEVSSSETLPDTDVNMNRVERKMNWEVIEETSKAINAKKGVVLNKLSAATMIKNELEINKGTLATAFVNLKSFSDKDIAVACNAINCLKELSFAFETSRPDIKQSDLVEDVKLAVKRLQGLKPKIDEFIKKYVTSQESKVGQMVASVSSCTTEVKEKGGEDSQVEMLLENQSSGDKTQDARNNKGKGNNKAKKSKKNKGKKK